jgi:hypothetical protein
MTIFLTILKKFWKLIVIIVLLLLIYLFFKQIQSLRKDNDRLLNNVEQLISNNNSKVLELTKDEFKKNYYDKDSLLKKIVDSINIKYKNIERTINNKYTFTYDTVITHLIPTPDTTIKNFNHKFDECVSVSGQINWRKSDITFDALKIDYNSTTVYYWERAHKFWFIKFGKKINKAITTNNCTGKTITTEIDIIKK